MSDANVRRWATGIAMAAVALLVATFVALYVAAGRVGAPVYAVGQRVDLPPSLYDGASRTLLVMVKTSCGDCQAAKPFLGQLVGELKRVDRSRAALVVMQSGEEEHAFAREIGLSPAQVVQLDLSRFSVQAVPTVLVVDGTGAIRFSLENAPSAGEQPALVAQYRDALKVP